MPVQLPLFSIRIFAISYFPVVRFVVVFEGWNGVTDHLLNVSYEVGEYVFRDHPELEVYGGI